MRREIGQSVVYVDATGHARDALVTAWHHRSPNSPDAESHVNLALVSTEPARTDRHGRQVVREVAVAHKDTRAAGPYWCWPDETGF